MNEGAFNEEIRQFTISDKNFADLWNGVNQKLLENTKYNKMKIEQLFIDLNEVLAQFDGYLTAEELYELLERGIKGDKGDPFKYEDFTVEQLEGLMGPQGIQGDKGNDGFLFTFEELTSEQKESITGPQGVKGADGARGADGLTTAVELNGTTYNHVNGLVTLPSYPTTLPASDVPDWAKAASKPSYTASEVGALASGGTAINSSALGGVSLDTLRAEIAKASGGDIVGKTMLYEEISLVSTSVVANGNLIKSYINNKGGMVRIIPTDTVTYNASTFPTSLTIVADGVTICSNVSALKLLGLNSADANNKGLLNFLDIPFKTAIQIYGVAQASTTKLSLVYYMNE